MIGMVHFCPIYSNFACSVLSSKQELIIFALRFFNNLPYNFTLNIFYLKYNI